MMMMMNMMMKMMLFVFRLTTGAQLTIEAGSCLHVFDHTDTTCHLDEGTVSPYESVLRLGRRRNYWVSLKSSRWFHAALIVCVSTESSVT